MAPNLFDVLACAAALFSVFYIRGKRKNSLPLPPGPKGYPIVGNLFDLSRAHVWIKFRDMAKDIGSDIIYLNILGADVVVLNSVEAVRDLLDKRSSIYSDRAHFLVSLDLMGFEWNLPTVGYGDLWRSQRRLMHNMLHPTAAKDWRPHTMRATRRALRNFVEKPDDALDIFHHMSGEIILNSTYGIQIKPEHDPYVETADETTRVIADAALPGSHLIDIIPIIKYIPSWMPGSFHSTAREGKKLAYRMLEVPYKAAKDRIDSGDYPPSFISMGLSMISQLPSEEFAWQEYVMKGAAATMYIGGTDTTSSTITYCVALLVNHPHVLKRAQEEVDAVISYGELPTFDEEERLPFINALIMESMRLKELLPFTVPHCVTEDDIYRGYRIPKGTIVIPNAWAMLHDEKHYPDPFSFKPERFIKDGKIDKDILDPTKIGFGFGRRVCPGRYMAISTLWLTIASLVAAFDIVKSVDANGKPIDVELADNDYIGLLRFPKPFKCTFKPRSEKHLQTIRATVDEEY